MFKTLAVAFGIAAMTTLFVPHNPATASDLPACADPGTDLDGDGFGWENGESCQIMADESQPPQITDLTSGAQVQFTQAVWELANVENKPVVCELHYWNTNSRTYDVSNVYSEIYYHSPIETSGIVSIDTIYPGHTNNYSIKKVLPWNIENGTYVGPADFGSSPWVEIVDAAGGFKNAVRIWRSDTNYVLCTAFPASATFIPTGGLPECIDTAPLGNGWGWDGTNTCKVLPDDNIGIADCPAYYVAPESECVDVFPVGDGWGWNGFASCEI